MPTDNRSLPLQLQLQSKQRWAQVNSIVLDGSVSKDERINHWTSAHKRIIFATPQAFKNDVFKGQPSHPVLADPYHAASRLLTVKLGHIAADLLSPCCVLLCR